MCATKAMQFRELTANVATVYKQRTSLSAYQLAVGLFWEVFNVKVEATDRFIVCCELTFHREAEGVAGNRFYKAASQAIAVSHKQTARGTTEWQNTFAVLAVEPVCTAHYRAVLRADRPVPLVAAVQPAKRGIKWVRREREPREVEIGQEVLGWHRVRGGFVSELQQCDLRFRANTKTDVSTKKCGEVNTWASVHNTQGGVIPSN